MTVTDPFALTRQIVPDDPPAIAPEEEKLTVAQRVQRFLVDNPDVEFSSAEIAEAVKVAHINTVNKPLRALCEASYKRWEDIDKDPQDSERRFWHVQQGAVHTYIRASAAFLGPRTRFAVVPKPSKKRKKPGAPPVEKKAPEPVPEPPAPEGPLVVLEVYPDHVRISHADAMEILHAVAAS